MGRSYEIKWRYIEGVRYRILYTLLLVSLVFSEIQFIGIAFGNIIYDIFESVISV